jgi:hypothetical protein
MSNKILVVFMLMILISCVFADQSNGKEKIQTTSSNRVGKVLLDTIVSGIKAAAIAKDGGYKTVDKLLQNGMARLRKARQDRLIDSVFYRRYKRILEILKLAIMDFSQDLEGILNDLIARQMQSFIYDITGENGDLSQTKSRGLGAVAKAVSFELLNLHIYLDTKDNRPDLVKKYFNVPPPPPKRKKAN